MSGLRIGRLLAERSGGCGFFGNYATCSDISARVRPAGWVLIVWFGVLDFDISDRIELEREGKRREEKRREDMLRRGSNPSASPPLLGLGSGINSGR